MSARSALARVEGWLLEPLPDAEPVWRPPATVVQLREVPRPVVAVVGVKPGCGVSTVARALAVRLALADPEGAAAVLAAGEAPRGLGGTSRAAARLRVRLRLPGAATAGRLCVVRSAEACGLAEQIRPLAPVVLDAPSAMESADLIVVVTPGDAEPALAQLVAASAGGGTALIVSNRPREPERWAGRAAVLLPESRLGARMAAAGWPAGGPFGRAIAELACACGALACA